MAVNESRTFTVENNVYKGEITCTPKSIGEILWNNIKSHGNKIAQIDACTEQVVTYAELQNKVVKCALWLQKQGIKLCDIVSLCTSNHFNSFVPCLATIYVNAIFNPWEENMNLQEKRVYVMRLTTPKMIFCTEKSVNVILSAIKKSNSNPIVVIFGNHLNVISFFDILTMCSDAEVTTFHYVECNVMDRKKTMCIMHSSGSTGLLKGVELSNYCLSYVSKDKNIDFTDTPIWFSTLYWVLGVMMNLFSIVQSAKVILYPEFDEEMICLLIEKYKITTVFLTSSMIHRFLKAGYIKKFPLLSLKVIFFGGGPIKPKTHEEIRRILSHVQILQCYGMTEVAGYRTLQCLNHKNGSCGTVIQNTEIKIVDLESGKALGSNQLGELWIKSVTQINGYYRNLEVTKKTVDEQGWLHSGDIGYFDEDGELFIVDRIKDLIKYRGYHISSGEIEGVLLSHPGVSEVAVTGIPHPTDDEYPIAYVTKMPGIEVTEQELIDLVANNMTDQYKLRGGVIFLNELPHTSTGKIAKNILKAMAKKLVVE
ncbi:LOW QUALITY PROTEIN: uncharacterized protein [Anoplolepis gracilipes]|uniref:LOW QUALITY PROTEIN: uncharacterized protein n=1 Tax=Anoplolepis gracilipes TaxID=354296 RepID=UPI003BA3793C